MIFSARSPSEVLQAIVFAISVVMAHLHTAWSWPEESENNEAGDRECSSLPFKPESYLSIAPPPLFTLGFSFLQLSRNPYLPFLQVHTCPSSLTAYPVNPGICWTVIFLTSGSTGQAVVELSEAMRTSYIGLSGKNSLEVHSSRLFALYHIHERGRPNKSPDFRHI